MTSRLLVTVPARIGFVLSLLLCVGCGSLKWKAPPKRVILQAQLEAIGRSAPIDIPQVLRDVKPVIDGAKADALKTNLRDKLQSVLPANVSFGFDTLWKAIETEIGDPEANLPQAKQRAYAAVNKHLTAADEDNRLYWRAKGPVERSRAEDRKTPPGGAVPLDPQSNRDALISKYIVRIQDYHEANYEDVFRSAADIGFSLDAGTTIASALATAFTPVSTKTALAALATILGGTRLAASKNILHEKTSAAVLNAMITQRTQALAVLTEGMKRPISEYTVDSAVVDLTTYFNVGGIDKALAQMEDDTSKAKAKAEERLNEAQKEPAAKDPKAPEGTFTVSKVAENGKRSARLVVAAGSAPGKLTVDEVKVNGTVLPADEYELRTPTREPTVVFEAQPEAGKTVEISGRTANAGAFTVTIEWK